MPTSDVSILAINEFGQDAQGGVPNAANLEAANGRDIALLQDTDANQDGSSDTWASAGATLGMTASQLWREVLVVDAAGDIRNNRNLTTYNLADEVNYDDLRATIMDIATEGREQDPAKPWQNAKEPYDVNHDGFVTAVGDVLPLISWFNTQGLGDLPTPTGEITTYLDVTGNNKALASDAFAIIRHINLSSITSAGNAAAEPEAALGAAYFSSEVSFSSGVSSSSAENLTVPDFDLVTYEQPEPAVDALATSNFETLAQAEPLESTCPGHAEATDAVFASALEAEHDDEAELLF